MHMALSDSMLGIMMVPLGPLLTSLAVDPEMYRFSHSLPGFAVRRTHFNRTHAVPAQHRGR